MDKEASCQLTKCKRQIEGIFLWRLDETVIVIPLGKQKLLRSYDLIRIIKKIMTKKVKNYKNFLLVVIMHYFLYIEL